MTIEEAWAALDYVGPQVEKRALMKQAMLAVLDELRQYTYCVDEFATVRRRIEELGK